MSLAIIAVLLANHKKSLGFAHCKRYLLFSFDSVTVAKSFYFSFFVSSVCEKNPSLPLQRNHGHHQQALLLSPPASHTRSSQTPPHISYYQPHNIQTSLQKSTIPSSRNIRAHSSCYISCFFFSQPTHLSINLYSKKKRDHIPLRCVMCKTHLTREIP